MPEQAKRTSSENAHPLPAGRGVLVIPHPGEEILGAVATLRHEGLERIVYVTDGAAPDGRDAARAGTPDVERYRQTRRTETRAALQAGGIDPDRAVFLGYGDQTAAFHLVSIARDLAAVLNSVDPAWVMTPAFAGRHPDEDATAMAAHGVVASRVQTGRAAPELWEFVAYSFVRDTAEAARSAAAAGFQAVPLGTAGQAFLQKLQAAHHSQARLRERERGGREFYRVAPHYDFADGPASGRPAYERQPWGMSAAQWRELAREAGDQLGLVCSMER